MNASDLRTLDDKGLLLRRQDLLGELSSLHFQAATGQLENTSTVRKVRRTLARVNTLIRERETERNLGKGGLDREVGSLDANETAFAAFRRAMGHGAQG